ncbi:MAG TPA: PIN domain-containing protein [Pyrinomonadaceae bacterium]|nr:PIN domain-containing protein [Pyrinomonadaceae bacterium]
MTYLLDSGFLYSSIDTNDIYHNAVVAIARSIRGRVLFPTPAITETAYFLSKNVGLASTIDFLGRLSTSEFELVSPEPTDLLRSAEILRKYNDSNIDFVDACIAAMAERLNITRILTVDRRHFSMFRPTHCEAFELLPQ